MTSPASLRVPFTMAVTADGARKANCIGSQVYGLRPPGQASWPL